MKVGIVDYGASNLASVSKALAAVGAEPARVSMPDDLADASALVIPGVGHFATVGGLGDDWRGAITAAISRGVPVLGICLGMQWLFDGSTEDAAVPGLGVFRGTCARLSGNVKVPHVGWNSIVHTSRRSALLAGIADGAAAYFTHSYAAPVTDAAVATTVHGRAFASVVEQGRIYGVQWHPEKSGVAGLALLANFVDLAKASSC